MIKMLAKIDKAKELAEGISNNLYAIYDYCNLNGIEKNYPLNLIENWSEKGKKQIDELEEILNKLHEH